uniref:Uncharacterized protein n=1 Tax=Pterocladiophila hemisphaerica TaxID=2712948 RepID=A0A6M3WWH3_9FLOR|nr:hypothetical protein [Pterocladiophila hemisphaerica]
MLNLNHFYNQQNYIKVFDTINNKIKVQDNYNKTNFVYKYEIKDISIQKLFLFETLCVRRIILLKKSDLLLVTFRKENYFIGFELFFHILKTHKINKILFSFFLPFNMQ